MFFQQEYRIYGIRGVIKNTFAALLRFVMFMPKLIATLVRIVAFTAGIIAFFAVVIAILVSATLGPSTVREFVGQPSFNINGISLVLGGFAVATLVADRFNRTKHERVLLRSFAAIFAAMAVYSAFAP